jgi:hypothetical protein
MEFANLSQSFVKINRDSRRVRFPSYNIDIHFGFDYYLTTFLHGLGRNLPPVITADEQIEKLIELVVPQADIDVIWKPTCRNPGQQRTN